MKHVMSKLLNTSLVAIISVGLLASCGKKVTDTHEHELKVLFSYSPTPAVVGTSVTLLFEVEEGGEHVRVDSVECEIEKAGTGVHEEVVLTENAEDIGHYSGVYTFKEAGDHEVHFKFIHDGKKEESHFDITVQS